MADDRISLNQFQSRVVNGIKRGNYFKLTICICEDQKEPTGFSFPLRQVGEINDNNWLTYVTPVRNFVASLILKVKNYMQFYGQ